MDAPKPTGKYKVGTKVVTTIDEDRVEELGPNKGNTKRRITYRIFYPVLPSDAQNLTNDELLSREVTLGMSKEFKIKIDYDKITSQGKNKAEYYKDAPHACGERFPLVIYNHGYKSYKEGNSFLCAELVSHGYVVISIGHPFEALAEVHTDGSADYFEKGLMKKSISPFLPGLIAEMKLTKSKGTPEELNQKFYAMQNKYCTFMVHRVDEWVKDTLFVIEEAKSLYQDFIAFDRGIAATGHSMGGAVAYNLCHKSKDIKCGINIDGGLFGNYEGMVMNKPFFQICSENNYNVEMKPRLNKTVPVYYATFKKIKHVGFADIMFYIRISAVVGKIPADVAHNTLCKCHLDFFDKYLKNEDIEINIPDNEFIKFEKFW